MHFFIALYVLSILLSKPIEIRTKPFDNPILDLSFSGISEDVDNPGAEKSVL